MNALINSLFVTNKNNDQGYGHDAVLARQSTNFTQAFSGRSASVVQPRILGSQ